MAEATTATGEPGAVGAVLPELVASFFTLSGAGFGEPPRNGFIERCEAAAAAGFSGIGMHADDLPRTQAAGLSTGEMQAVLRINGLDVVEIEFLGGWAVLDGVTPRRESFAGTVSGRYRGGRERVSAAVT